MSASCKDLVPVLEKLHGPGGDLFKVHETQMLAADAGQRTCDRLSGGCPEDGESVLTLPMKPRGVFPFGLSLEASSTPSSAQTSPSLWLPCCQSQHISRQLTIDISRRLLIVASSAPPKLLQLPRRRSNPFSDVRHSRLVDRNAIVLTLLHLHSLFQIRGEAVCGAVELFEGWVSVVSGALRLVKGSRKHLRVVLQLNSTCAGSGLY